MTAPSGPALAETVGVEDLSVTGADDAGLDGVQPDRRVAVASRARVVRRMGGLLAEWVALGT
jgi:hypothetical protein